MSMPGGPSFERPIQCHSPNILDSIVSDPADTVSNPDVPDTQGLQPEDNFVNVLEIPSMVVAKPLDQIQYGSHTIDFWVRGRKGIQLSAAMDRVFEDLADPNSEVMHAESQMITYKVQVRINRKWCGVFGGDNSPSGQDAANLSPREMLDVGCQAEHREELELPIKWRK